MNSPILKILDAEDSQNLFSVLNKAIIDQSFDANLLYLAGQINKRHLKEKLKDVDSLKEIYKKLWGKDYK